MKKEENYISKELRDKVLVDIVTQYREKQKKPSKTQMVNLFIIWEKMDISYSDFIEIIDYWENKGYITSSERN